MGHSVALVGGEPFKPIGNETYPFDVRWWECNCKKSVCRTVYLLCRNTDTNVIDHGVNLNKFKVSTEKNNSFVVCSQLIERKKNFRGRHRL